MPPKAKRASAPKGLTKAQLTSEIAEKAILSKAQVSSVLTALADITAGEIRSGRPVTVPGLVKVTMVKKAATAARQGTNPFTGEPMTIKAKPARRAVKVRPVKALKEAV